MQLQNGSGILLENALIYSRHLDREVIVDFYLPQNVKEPSDLNLLFINDGQNMEELGLLTMLSALHEKGEIKPLLCAAIHAGADRKMEYGIASQADYLGRGARAGDYGRFIREELLPYIYDTYRIGGFAEMAFAGFSLGGLTALDMVWHHPALFRKAGVFSGSLWWRSIDQDDPAYDDHLHRIMHQEIRSGQFNPGQRFFFQSGNKDETFDRNNNGIIDSIDDTLDLVAELTAKGYDPQKDIFYLELPEGRHDIPTWAEAMPVFLKWGWGK